MQREKMSWAYAFVAMPWRKDTYPGIAVSQFTLRAVAVLTFAAAGLFCATPLSAASVVFRKDFPGNTQTRQQAIVARRASLGAVATDRDGNVYVAGSTAIGELPVLNAEQPAVRSGSLVRSEDGGRTWEPLPIPTVAVYPPAMHPRTPSTLLVSGVFGVVRSTDAGRTWEVAVDLNDPAKRSAIGYIDRVLYDPNDPNRAYAGATGGVLRTLDGGATWTLLTAGLDPGHCCTGAPLAVDPVRPNRLLYSINERAYVSEDRGDTWRALRLPETQGGTRVAPDAFRADTWYLRTYQAAWVTTDAGSTWKRLPIESKLLTDLIPDRMAEGVLIAVTAEGLLQSADRGQTWSPLPLGTGAPESIVDLRFDPVLGSRWYASSQGASGSRRMSYVSDDRGATWRFLGQTREMEFATEPNSVNRIYAAGNSAMDAWVAKYTPDGDLVFATYFGGQGDDQATAIAVDAGGNIYAGGTTSSTDLPARAGQFGSDLKPSIFVSTFDAAGRLLKTTIFGGSEYDQFGGIGVGPDGSVHLAFVTRSPDLPVSAGAIEGASEMPWQGYYARLSSDGDRLLFSTYLGRADSGEITLAVDGSGSALIGGWLLHPSYVENPSPLWPPRETGEANLLKFSPSGMLVAAARVPASVKAVAASETGDIYVAGNASINDLIVLPATAYQRRIDTACPHDSGLMVPSRLRAQYMTDVWFAHLDSNASSLVGGTLFGGSCVEGLEHLAVSADGSVTLAGQGYSDPLPATEPIAFAPTPGRKRVFIARFDGGGSNLLASSYIQPAQRARIAARGDAVALIADAPSSYTEPPPSLWKIAYGARSELTITGVRNAFGATNTAIVPGGIVTISAAGLPEDISEYLGLNPTAGAPTEIGGVTVSFDGLPARLLGVGPGEIVAVAPAALRAPGTAQVSIRTATGPQGSFYVDAANALPAFYPDIRNADGTLNAPGNPAISGSSVTIFFTGVPPPEAGFRDGELAPEGAPASPLTMNLWVREAGQSVEIRDLRPVPGFVFGLYYATIPAPTGNGQLTLEASGILNSIRISVRTGD